MKRWLVVTPTLGESPYLEEAIASVRALGRDVLHRIVAPPAQWPGLVRRAPTAELVADDGSGLYAAIRQGTADAARFDGVTWLNDDDRLIAEGTRAALREVDAGSQLVYGRVGLMDEDGTEWGWLPVCRRGADLPSLLTRGIVALAQPGTWLSGECWNRLGGVDSTYRLAGDLDLFSRAAREAAKITYVPQPLARFRLRAGQLSQQRELAAREKRRALASAKPQPAWGPRLRFALCNLDTYLDRIRRHGLASMATIYQRGGGRRR